MKLYYTPGACSLAVHIVLEWSGIEYQTEVVPFGDEKLKRVYPEGGGKVPILDRHNGASPLTQTPVILRFIADSKPQVDIGGGALLEGSTEVDRWLAFLCADLHPCFHPLFVTDRYTTQTNNEALISVKNAAMVLVRKELTILNKHLNCQCFIVGDKLSIADAYAFPMLRWAMDKLPEKLSQFPNLERLHDTVFEDMGVQQVMADEGLL